MYAISPARLSFSTQSSDYTPISCDYDDVYYMPNHAFEEIDYVSLRGNGLHERFAQTTDFTIAELGFGTGLNFHLTTQLWQKLAHKSAKLTYISIEKHPISAADLLELHQKLGIAEESRQWRSQYPSPLYGVYPLHLSHNIQLILIFMEAICGVQQINDASINAWFLDGFAPAKNPDMWNDDILKHVARTLKPQGTFATFTAASSVRQSLQQHGVVVEKIKGYGCKRHMLIGKKL